MNKKIINIIFWAVMLVLIIVLAKNLYSNYSSKANIESTLQQLPKTGQVENGEKTDPIAPDFSLKDLQGNTVKLSDYRGKVVIINFWASWCPPCRSELPDFNKASAEITKGKDAIILAVNTTNGYNGETPDKVRKFVKENNLTMKILLDEKDEASTLYGISSLPTTFIIKKDGTVHGYQVGPLSYEQIMGLVDKLK